MIPRDRRARTRTRRHRTALRWRRGSNRDGETETDAIAPAEEAAVDVSVEAVDLEELIEHVFARVRPFADDRGCALELRDDGAPRRVYTDPAHVQRVLSRFLTVAVRFGDARPVAVSCRAAADGGIVIEIRDHGVGIAATDLPHAFKECVELERKAATAAALTLANARAVIRRLGGTIIVESAPGVGSTFRLTLPRRAPEAAETRTAA